MINVLVDELIKNLVNLKSDNLVDLYIGWTDRWTDRWMDGYMDAWMNDG